MTNHPSLSVSPTGCDLFPPAANKEETTGPSPPLHLSTVSNRGSRCQRKTPPGTAPSSPQTEPGQKVTDFRCGAVAGGARKSYNATQDMAEAEFLRAQRGRHKAEQAAEAGGGKVGNKS